MKDIRDSLLAGQVRVTWSTYLAHSNVCICGTNFRELGIWRISFNFGINFY